MKKLLCAVLGVICFSGYAWAGENFDKGVELFEAGKYTDAMIAWKKAVEEGDGNAADMIGYLYQTGRTDIPKNPEKAIEWYQKAIDMGSEKGRLSMALFYIYEGKGSVEEEDNAYTLIKGLENSNDDFVLANVSIFYANGWGTPVDFAKAREIVGKISDPDLEQKRLDVINEEEKAQSPIPAKTVIAEVSQNQMRFDKNYKGNLIATEGFVGSIEDAGESYVLKLFGERSLLNSFDYIRCFIKRSQEDALLGLNKGDHVKIKGIYVGQQRGQAGAMVLYYCAIIK
jgi:tetratricopeptide (TPR) repeat protein